MSRWQRTILNLIINCIIKAMQIKHDFPVGSKDTNQRSPRYQPVIMDFITGYLWLTAPAGLSNTSCEIFPWASNSNGILMNKLGRQLVIGGEGHRIDVKKIYNGINPGAAYQ
jgi:hypothetical protein